MANKRVSMKGRGADLFFGDYIPPKAPVAHAVSPDDVAVVAADSPPPSSSLVTEDIAGPDSVTPKPSELVSPVTPPVAASAESGASLQRAAGKRTTMQASMGASKRASSIAFERDVKLASTLAISIEAVEAIRRAVREPGREVAYVRLTPEEKGMVGDIVHAYKKRGQRTTENELHRIAINHLLQDYHEHGEGSVLARVLASLLA